MNMKKNLILILLFVISFSALWAEEKSLRSGLLFNYYNEPALKSGATVGVDWEWPLIRSWRFGVVLPEITYFYFPDNYEAWYFYPEFSLRYIGPKGFYFALGSSAGLSLSRKVVPVYNLEGELIDDPFTRQLVLMVQAYFGMDFAQRYSRAFRIYVSLGWKGLYPNNLGFQNQPMLQLGINYRINRSKGE
jgi:hypothetical protein